jgi:uncharacterized protein YecT (DUF1311 family)
VRTILLTALAGLAPFAAGLAAGQEASGSPNIDRYYSKTYNDCMAAAGGSTYPTRDCQNAELDNWDKALNGAYQQLLSRAAPPDKLKLRDEERAWLRQTTHKCDHAGDDEVGGTLQPIEVADCYLTEKILRAVELRKRL